MQAMSEAFGSHAKFGTRENHPQVGPEKQKGIIHREAFKRAERTPFFAAPFSTRRQTSAM